MSSLGSRIRSKVEIDEEYENITYEYFHIPAPTAFHADLNYLYRLKKRKAEIDLVHSHMLSGAVASCLLNLPSILTLHGMVWREKNYQSNPYSHLTYKINGVRFQYASSKLTKMIAISPYVIEEVDGLLNNQSINMEVIENPISDIFFTVNKEEVEGLLIYPGGIGRLKNQIGLIQALDLLKREKIRFHCILPGPVVDNGYLSELRSTIKKCGLEKDITIPGVFSLSQLLDLYSKASIMALTSFQETAPMIISEAMAAGIPVVASRIAGIPHMVSSGESGFLIDPQSSEEIAEYLAILLGDDLLRRRMQEESRRIANSRWRNDLIVSKQLDEYRNAVAFVQSLS
jgi:glycosyltransferase involved in cell wall biosynthesis